MGCVSSAVSGPFVIPPPTRRTLLVSVTGFAKRALLGDRLTTLHVSDVIGIRLTLHCTDDDGFGLLELFLSDVLVTLMPSVASALSGSLETCDMWSSLAWSLTDDSSWRTFQTLRLRAYNLWTQFSVVFRVNEVKGHFLSVRKEGPLSHVEWGRCSAGSPRVAWSAGFKRVGT